MTRRSFLATPSLLSVACRHGSRGIDGLAFIANQDGKSIAVIDLAHFVVLRRILLEANPSEMLAHPSLPVFYALLQAAGVVLEIDAVSHKVMRRAAAGHPLNGMRLMGGDLWLLSGGARALLRLPLDSFRLKAAFTLPLEPAAFDLAPPTGLAAISFGESGQVQMINLLEPRMQAAISIGGAVGVLRFRSDGKALLAGNRSARILSVLHAPDGRVITHLPLAVRPDHFCFHPDGGQLFITGEGMDAVVVVYPHHVPQVALTTLAGRAPGAMAASDQYLFVANPLTNDISIFNIDNKRLMAVTAVGYEPGHIAVTPGNEFALVLNRASGDVAVIRIGAIAEMRTKSATPPAALFTMIPVGSTPVSAVVSMI